MLDIQRAVTFSKVVETGSFSRAAENLGVVNSTVSKQVAALEKSLGVRLLERTTRQLRVTEEGKVLYEQCLKINEALESMREQTSALKEVPRGCLKIATPSFIAKTKLAQGLPAFLANYPALTVDLVISERLEDLFSGGFDLGIRVGDSYDRNTHASTYLLGRNHSILCATPEYLDRHGTPVNVAELKEHNCLVWKNEQRVMREWTLEKNGKIERTQINGNISSNDIIMIKETTLSNGGIALLPGYGVEKEIDNKQLIHLLPDYHSLDFQIYALYPQKKNVPAKVRAFIEYIRQYF